MKNNLKKVTAGLLALSLVTGTVPVQPIAELFTNQTAITASADMAGEPSWASERTKLHLANFFKLNTEYRVDSSYEYVCYNHSDNYTTNLSSGYGYFKKYSNGTIEIKNQVVCTYDTDTSIYGTVVGVVRGNDDGYNSSRAMWFYPVYKGDYGNYFAVFDGNTIPFSITRPGDIFLPNNKKSTYIYFDNGGKNTYTGVYGENHEYKNNWSYKYIDSNTRLYQINTSVNGDVVFKTDVKHINNATLNTDLTYNRSSQFPANFDYQVVSNSTGAQTNTGTYSSTIVGTGQYFGKRSSTWSIKAKTVNNPTIQLSQGSFVYDGTEKKPTVTVKDGNNVIPASEYSVHYSNNVNKGTATVTISDNPGGNYTPSGSTTFTITKPVATPAGTFTSDGHTYNIYSGTSGFLNVTDIKEGDVLLKGTKIYGQFVLKDPDHIYNSETKTGGLCDMRYSNGTYPLDHSVKVNQLSPS